MELSERQKNILEIVKKYAPIIASDIAEKLSLNKSTIRTDLSILVKSGFIISRTNTGYFYNYDLIDTKKYDILKEKKVFEVMGLGITAKIDEKVSSVVSKLFIHDIGTIFIVNEENNLVGVVSRKDLLKILNSSVNSHNIPIVMAMTRVPNVVYTEKDENLLDPLRKLINHEIDCLPVIEKKENNLEVIGRISKTTMVRILLDVLEK